MAQNWDEQEIDQLRAAGSLKWNTHGQAIGAWVAEMDFGLAPPVREALRSYAESELFGYSPPSLEQDLARATNEYVCRNFQWSPGPENVVPTGDVLAGLGAVLDFYTRPGSPVVLPTPAYMPFLKYPLLKDREIIEVPMLREAGGWQMDFAGIDTALAAGGGLVILCNPHNPIGKMYSRGELEHLCAVVARHDARVFSDEIHASIHYAGQTHLPYALVNEQAATQAITATSASKTFNIPGLKCAQLLFSNLGDLEIWKERGFFVSHGASVPGQLATIAAYDHAAPWRDEVVDYLQGNRDLLGQLLTEHLGEISWVAPQGTYLAWLDASALEIHANPQKFMLERAAVALVDGADCGRGFDNFLRLNFAMPRPLLTQTVERMARALANR